MACDCSPITPITDAEVEEESQIRCNWEEWLREKGLLLKLYQQELE
jgi:hypothetical protein